MKLMRIRSQEPITSALVPNEAKLIPVSGKHYIWATSLSIFFLADCLYVYPAWEEAVTSHLGESSSSKLH